MSVIAGAATVASTVNSIQQGQEQKKAAKASQAQAQSAQDQAQKNSEQVAKQQEKALNKPKAPNIAGLLAANQSAASGGVSSTMLTGPAGVDMSGMVLGKNTLLGQ